MLTKSPYTVDSDFMARVEQVHAVAMTMCVCKRTLCSCVQVLDWSLKRGLVTVVNVHHDEWLEVGKPLAHAPTHALTLAHSHSSRLLPPRSSDSLRDLDPEAHAAPQHRPAQGGPQLALPTITTHHHHSMSP